MLLPLSVRLFHSGLVDHFRTVHWAYSARPGACLHQQWVWRISVLCKLYYRSRCCHPAGGIRVCNSGMCWVSTRGLAHLCRATDSLSTHPPSWFCHWPGRCLVPGSWAGISSHILYPPPCGRSMQHRHINPRLPQPVGCTRLASYRRLKDRGTSPQRRAAAIPACAS